MHGVLQVSCTLAPPLYYCNNLFGRAIPEGGDNRTESQPKDALLVLPQRGSGASPAASPTIPHHMPTISHHSRAQGQIHLPSALYHGGCDSLGLDANYPPPPPTNRWLEAPWARGGGGLGTGDSRRGDQGCLGGALGGGGARRVGWGRLRVGHLGATCPQGQVLVINLTKTEYWDRAGGGGNISYEW